MQKLRNRVPIDVSVAVLSQLARYLSHLNINTDKLFKSLGMDPAIINCPDARIPIESYIAIENEAIRISNDPYFGLHMGEFIQAGNYGIIGYIMMNSRTLGESLEKSGRYHKIIGTLITPHARLGFKTIKIIFTIPKYAPKISHHCFTSAFAGVITMMRNLTGKQINPREIGFIHTAPDSIAEYSRIFCSPVLFDQKHNYMIFDLSLGKIPILQPNPELLEYFENYAREILTQIEEVDKTTQTVIKLILEHMDRKTLSISNIAREMSISVRTLQNLLKTQGTAFSKLLDQTRERLAKKCLRENHTVEEITCLLGFSEASTFRKAFKKWSGNTPREYREMVLTKE